MELTEDEKLKEMLQHMENKLQETTSNPIYKTEAQAAAFYEASNKQTEIELKAEGKIEGKIEGRIEGRIEGKIEEKFNSVQLLMKNMNIPLEKALEILEISKEEYDLYLKIIQ